MTGSHRERVEDRVPQPRIYKVWNVAQRGSPGEAYLDLVSSCLAGGKDSRLYKRLVYDEQIATSVAASDYNREIAGQFTITATLKPGQDLTKAESAIDEEVARLIAAGPTADELERAKTTYLAEFVRGLDRVGGFGGKSDVLAEGQVFMGDPSAYKNWMRYKETATVAQVQAAAKQWLSDGDFVLEVVPFPTFTTAVSPIDRSKLPEVSAPAEGKLPRLQRGTLSNGLKIVVAERHETPIVDAMMLFDAGYAADQFASPGTASLTMTLLTDGTRTRDALKISNDLQRLGAQLQAGSGLDASTIFLSALKPKLDDSLALFADVILNPSFPEADFQRERKLLLARIEQEKVQPNPIASRVLPALIYGKDHAYGNPWTGSGTAASVAKIGREDLIKFHGTWIKPNAATLIIAGDTTLSEIQPKLERLFAAWRPGEIPKKNLAKVGLPPKPAVYLIDRPGAAQSVIVAAERALPKNSPQEVATDVMNDMIGGTFSSRLNMNLREDKHWSYGAFSQFRAAKGQQPFIARAPVQTDKTKESLAEMNKELHEFAATKPVTDTELLATASNRTMSLPGMRESLDSVVSAVQEIVEFGYPDDYFDTYVAKVRSLRTADIQDAARSVLHPDNLIWIVVGDRAKVESGIRALNIGELHVIDADGNAVK